jgi:hypothetical protein
MYKPNWIKLEPPQVALNAPNVHKQFVMKYSPVVPWDKSAHDILSGYVPKGVRHLVFNCHGNISGGTWEGVPSLTLGTVFHPGNVSAFELLYSILELRVIWISACNLGGSAAGLNFCKEMARKSGCYVVTQTTAVPDVAVRAGCIEDYNYAMPQYIDPFGAMVARSDFFDKVGPEMGFKRI